MTKSPWRIHDVESFSAGKKAQIAAEHLQEVMISGKVKLIFLRNSSEGTLWEGNICTPRSKLLKSFLHQGKHTIIAQVIIEMCML